MLEMFCIKPGPCRTECLTILKTHLAYTHFSNFKAARKVFIDFQLPIQEEGFNQTDPKSIPRFF